MGQGSSISVRNETEITLRVELTVLLPYYSGEVKPGETFKVETGAVWFTVEVRPADPDSTRVSGHELS